MGDKPGVIRQGPDRGGHWDLGFLLEDIEPLNDFLNAYKDTELF